MKQTGWAATYSIVARDPVTGELGAAVQSHWFNVGSIVPWVEAGVGVVATQSFVEPSYGPRGLERMRAGEPPADALRSLVEEDEGREVRQVAFVDAQGRVAAHTGSRCIEWAGHRTGDGYSAQGNMMRNDRVVPAMCRAFETTDAPLAERLVLALKAAEEAGGDIRGRQSAAVLVARGRRTGKPWLDRTVDLRVEDHPEPVYELLRLLALHRAYEHMSRGDEALERKEFPAALAHYHAAARLAPGNLEVVFWHAVGLARNDRLEEALPLFRQAFGKDRSWADLLRRLSRPGILPDDLAQRILRETA